VTRDLLLKAALQVFALVGYESAQVEEIADAAGFSKGALYAHFKSKEELFLALYETKAASYLARIRRALESAPTRAGKIDAFRSFYIDMSNDKEWALISLEAKLFVIRHPEVKERLRKIDERAGDSVEGALTRLFGNSARAAGGALGGIFAALVLQAALEPEVVPERKMRAMLGTVFDALLGLSDQGTQTGRIRAEQSVTKLNERRLCNEGTASGGPIKPINQSWASAPAKPKTGLLKKVRRKSALLTAPTM